MNYKELADQILVYVGGKENIGDVGHCATRLRFHLNDDAKAQTSKIEQLQGVVSVINKGGQYQVVIGNDVVDVFKELKASLGDFPETKPQNGGTKGVITRILDTISGIFFPIVPALAGAGMLKAVLSFLSVMKLVEPTSQSYQILNFMGDALFYFLPVVVAASAAKKLKVNSYVAMAIGAMLIHPTFIAMASDAKTNGELLSFFGLPISPVSYTSSVIPVILAIWFMSYVEPFVEQHMFKPIRLFMTPLITMFIVGVVSFVILGPLGYYCGTGLGSLIDVINQYASWLVPPLVGTFTPLMVMTGMHYGLIPLGINQLAISGIDTIAGPGMLVSNIAQGGAALAVAFKTKSMSIKSLATSAGISAVCGVTEPAMYGISLRFKKPLIAAMIGGGVGGLFLGIMNVGRYAQVAPGLFALPSFIGEQGICNFLYACIATALSFLVSFIVSYCLGIEEPQEETRESKKELVVQDDVISAPLKGTFLPLAQVKDPVFSSGTMGEGLAIVPSEGILYAPADGTIKVLFPTHHAIGMITNSGVELLIHVGMDTVELQGKYFQPRIQAGAQVKQGDILLEFDMEAIQQRGYDLTTPIIITNASNFDINKTDTTEIQPNELLLQVQVKELIK